LKFIRLMFKHFIFYFRRVCDCYNVNRSLTASSTCPPRACLIVYLLHPTVHDYYRSIKEIPVDPSRQDDESTGGTMNAPMDANVKRRRGLVERGGVSSTWINTEEQAGASTFCEKQYSRAADTRRTLSTVDPS